MKTCGPYREQCRPWYTALHSTIVLQQFSAWTQNVLVLMLLPGCNATSWLIALYKYSY